MFKRQKSQPEAQLISEVVRSNLLPWVFEGFDPDQPLQVLDAGVGCQSTVEFFTGFPSRVFFLDLLSEVPADSALDAQAAERLFAQVLKPYKGTLFDVCLFWEILNLLETPILIGLSNALRPYVYSQTRGYVACSLNPDTPQAYRLLDQRSLRVMPGKSPINDWSLTRLASEFDCFAVQHDCVTCERVEVSMLAD